MRSERVLMVWIGLICLLVLAAPWLAPHDPLTQNLPRQLESPSAEHWLGTDFFGRDVFSRLLYGGRATLWMGLAASLISAGVGLGLGSLATLEIPWLTFWIERLLESLLALPSLLIALLAITLLGTSPTSVTLAVGLSGVGVYGSTARDHLRYILVQPYIEGAVSLGASRPYILWAYVWPNARPHLLTFWGVLFTWALLNGSALTFLGFVPNPDDPNWGVMLAAGRQTFLHAPYEALSAGLALTLTVGALNRLTG